ncbi:MAG TPA: hypothetical protein VEE84_02095, partial [Burkholderiaceae bacterium]|nr:hypothetical protein [Burkholderiaceae bacterium]
MSDAAKPPVQGTSRKPLALGRPARSRCPAALLGRWVGPGALAWTAVAAQAQSGASAADGPSFLPMALALVLVLGLLGAALWV